MTNQEKKIKNTLNLKGQRQIVIILIKKKINLALIIINKIININPLFLCMLSPHLLFFCKTSLLPII